MNGGEAISRRVSLSAFFSNRALSKLSLKCNISNYTLSFRRRYVSQPIMPDELNLSIVMYQDFYYSPSIIRMHIADNFNYSEFTQIIKSFVQVNTKGVE